MVLLQAWLYSSPVSAVHTNLPQAGFELGSLGPQAGVLPFEPPLLVNFYAVFV